SGVALGLVAVLAEVHDLGERGIGVGGDLDQVELGFLSGFEGVVQGKHAQVFTLGDDDAKLPRADAGVDARLDPLVVVIRFVQNFWLLSTNRSLEESGDYWVEIYHIFAQKPAATSS